MWQSFLLKAMPFTEKKVNTYSLSAFSSCKTGIFGIRIRLQAIGEDVFDCMDIQHGIECVAAFTRV